MSLELNNTLTLREKYKIVSLYRKSILIMAAIFLLHPNKVTRRQIQTSSKKTVFFLNECASLDCWHRHICTQCLFQLSTFILASLRTIVTQSIRSSSTFKGESNIRFIYVFCSQFCWVTSEQEYLIQSHFMHCITVMEFFPSGFMLWSLFPFINS